MTDVLVVDVHYVSEMVDGEWMTEIQVIGRRASGESVRVRVRGFKPYFYCGAPLMEDGTTAVDGCAEQAMVALNHVLRRKASEFAASQKNYIRKKEDQFKAITFSVQVVRRTPVRGYHTERDVLRIVCSHPDAVAPMRDEIVKRGVRLGAGLGELPRQAYEASLEYVLRFMVDTGVRCGAWIRVDDRALPEWGDSTCTSADLRCESPDYIRPYSDDEEDRLKEQGVLVTRLKLLSFDIECDAEQGKFPKPTVPGDRIIQIACDTTWLDQRPPEEIEASAETVLFALRDTADVGEGVDVRCYEDEGVMLTDFAQFIQRECDPDVITSYNGPNFDWKYIVARAEFLGVQWEATMFSRIPRHMTRNRESSRSTRAHGTSKDNEVIMPGRVIFDMLKPIQKNLRERSYALRFIAAKHLGETKEDVDYKEISGLWHGNRDTRARLGAYCVQDARLPRRLLIKMQMLTQFIEVARVCRVPINFLTTKGEQIKVFTQLHYKARQEGYIVEYYVRDGSEEKYQGATVINPARGFYTTPIATLDFASLYPSIMLAHNLCYTTFLPPGCKKKNGKGEEEEWGEDEYETSPKGHRFLRSSVRRGLLPSILEDLLAARKRAKGLMAEARKKGDDFAYGVYDMRQLALKISANSVYGFTGVAVGKLPLKQIAESVTGYGRQMIDLTWATVEEVGPPGTRVIYGDTDSVMIRYPCSVPIGPNGKLTDVAAAVAEARTFALAGAEAVNAKFRKPISLLYEKVFWPYLLISKKRYVGGYFEDPEPVRMKIMARGIESQRRDNCNMLPRLIDDVVLCLMDDLAPDRAIDIVRDAVSAVVTGPMHPERIADRCASSAAWALRTQLVSGDAGACDDAADALATEFWKDVAPRMRRDTLDDADDPTPRIHLDAWVQHARGCVDAHLTGLLANDGTVAEISDRVAREIEDTLCQTTVIDDYVISKKYGKPEDEYKPGTVLPHIELMKRMRARSEIHSDDDIAAGYKVYLGDRVNYVMAAPSPAHPAKRGADRAEDVRWLLAHDCRIDAVYYVENQMLKPLARLLKPLVGGKAPAIQRMTQHVRTRSSTGSAFNAARFASKNRLCIFGTYDGPGVGRRKREDTPAQVADKAKENALAAVAASSAAATVEAVVTDANANADNGEGEEDGGLSRPLKRARADTNRGPLDVFFSR